jgi:hypothetical protein
MEGVMLSGRKLAVIVAAPAVAGTDGSGSG